MIQPQLKPEVKATLEMHGVEAVRMMLVKYPFGFVQDDIIPGLQTEGGTWVKRDDAETWLLWKVAEQVRDTARRDSIRFWWGMFLTAVAAIASVAAAWEGRSTFFH